MSYFTFTFEVFTRPWFRKGRPKLEQITIAAHDLLTALRIARETAESNWDRRRWQMKAWKIVREEKELALTPKP